MPLPAEKQTRTGTVTPLEARVLLSGTPGVGKTTLAAGWAPETTLILDTQNGTRFLDGEHWVQPCRKWLDFEETVRSLQAFGHGYRTVVVDLVDDLWLLCDKAHAAKGKLSASASNDYGRSIAAARHDFKNTVGQLLNTTLGVWFVSHTREANDDGITIRRPGPADKETANYLLGACEFAFFAELKGPQRMLYTQPSARHEAKSRVPLPERIPLHPRELYAAIAAGLKAGTTETEGEGEQQ